jgi:signal transduction histidine kinase
VVMAMTLRAAVGGARRRKAAIVLRPAGERRSYLVMTRPSLGARYGGLVTRLRALLAARGVDALIVIVALAGAVGTLARTDHYRPDDGLQLGFEAAAVAVMILGLLLRRRAPFVAPAGTWLVSAGLSFLDGRLIVGQAPISVAGMIAAILLGNLREERKARAGLMVVVVCALTIIYNDPTHSVGSLFFVPVLFAVGWLVGFALRERAVQTEAAEQRAARAERERENAARLAVAEERARIARELHDVVAHAVSVMVLQVGAVRHRMPPGAADREALHNVENAGRTALAEMRRLLGAMRRDDDELDLTPQPGLDMLPSLMEDVRAAGLDVRLQVEGQPGPLSRGLDLSAYRILQEGLTNVLKHAQAQVAYVRVHYDVNQLELEVRDDGRGPTPSDGLGHGLVGIGERVKIYGGELTAGGTGAGGFALNVRLPLNGR